MDGSKLAGGIIGQYTGKIPPEEQAKKGAHPYGCAPSFRYFLPSLQLDHTASPQDENQYIQPQQYDQV